MEQKIFNKFNLYDQVGYLMVGAICILIICFNTITYELGEIPDLSINNFIVWFVIAYFLGHFIQSISNVISKIPVIKYLIKEKNSEFNDPDIQILNKAKEYFKIDTQDYNRIWNLCYLKSASNDTTGQILAFNSNYGLYRGWLTLFILNSFFLIVEFIKHINTLNAFVLGINILFVVVFHYRVIRFWKYLRNKVLDIFTIIYLDNQ